MTPRQRLYRAYLLTSHWFKLRTAVLERDGYQCTRCPCRKRLQVHHLRYETRFEDAKHSDLITLCRACHEREHGISKRRKKFKRAPKWNKAARVKPVRPAKPHVEIVDWRTLQLARTNHQITRQEFLKLSALYPSPVYAHNHNYSQPFTPGMYEKKTNGNSTGSAYKGKHWLNGKSFEE